MQPRRIEVPLPFALRSANAWLFDGAQPALVDCGLGSEEAYQALLAGINAANVDPRNLRLFISHGHVDHAGNAGRLHRDFGIELCAPKVESSFVESFRRDHLPRNDAFAAALMLHGAPPEVVAQVRDRSAAIDIHLDDTPIQLPLHDGMKVQLGDTVATAILAPGHTPGSTLFVTEDNDILTGDTLLEHITSNAIELLEQDRGRYHQYLRTLDGLRRFVGCRALPGHHAEFMLTDALLDYHMEKHHRRSRRVLDNLVEPRTAWQLLPKVLPHLAADQTFLGMCEVVGHLHALEIDGNAMSSLVDGKRFFHAA